MFFHVFSYKLAIFGGVLPHFPSGGAMFSCRACVPRDKDADTVKVSVADIEAREVPENPWDGIWMGNASSLAFLLEHPVWKANSKACLKPIWQRRCAEYIYIIIYIYMILSDFWLAKIWSVHVSPGPLGDLVMPPWPAARPAGHWTMGCWSDASEFLTSQVWSSCGKSLDTPINSNKLNIWLWVKTLVPSYPQK